MNSDEPFTSVNWDREETDTGASKTPQPRALNTLDDHYPSIMEENIADEKSPSFPATLPLDSSSLRLDIDGKKLEPLSTLGNHIKEANFGEDFGSDFGATYKEEPQAAAGWEKHGENKQKDLRNEEIDLAVKIAASKSPQSDSGVVPHVEPENLHIQAGFEESSPEQPPKYSPVESEEITSTTNDSVHQKSYAPELEAQNTENHEISGQQQMEAAFAQHTLDVHVTNPISDRDGNSKPYISYLVTSETNHPEVLRLLAANGNAAKTGEKTTVKVRRRYGDFRFLHDCLVNDFPQLLVPPLPAKLNFKYLTGDTFSTSFVHKRLNSLDRFVTFICQHKLLSQLSVFHFFVSDSAEWASFTKNLKILKGEDGDGLLVGKVVNEDLLTETIMNFFTPSKHKRETNKDILEISDKLKKLYENLIKLDRIFSKLNKKNTDLKHDYELFLNQINKLASLHENNTHFDSGALDANVSYASSIETTQTAIPGNFKIFSESLLFFLENWAGLGRYIDESFLVSLKDCAKYIARLSNLIELHHNKKIDLQVLEDYLTKAKGDLANLGGGGLTGSGDASSRAPPNPALFGQNTGGLVNNTTQLIKDTLSTSATPHIGSSQTEGKKQRLQQKIVHLEQEIASQTLLVNNLTSRIIHEEYPNWDRFNKVQMKKSMSDLCDHEISFYKGMVDNWTDVEAKLVKRLEELK